MKKWQSFSAVFGRSFLARSLERTLKICFNDRLQKGAHPFVNEVVVGSLFIKSKAACVVMYILYYSGYGCVSIGTVVHEMLHAAGFWHEQSRPDRDQHVSVLWENISPGREDNFARYSRAEVSTLSLPYDTQSVMHYSATAFSRNGQYTITPLK